MDQLPQWISSYHLLPAVFVGTFFFGETVVLAGTVLVATGALPLPWLFALCLLANLASDLLWLLFGQQLLRLGSRSRWVRTRSEAAMAMLHRFDEQRRFHYLLFFKFVYGLRIVTIVYTSLRRVSLRRFLLFDCIGSGAYLLVVIGLGLLLWEGATAVAPAMHTLRYALAAPVLLFILLRMGTQWFRKRLFDA